VQCSLVYRKHVELVSPLLRLDIRDKLTFLLTKILEKVQKIMFGDAIEMPRFREALDGVIDEVLGGQVQVVDRQPEFSAAKGVAELAKRAIFMQKQFQDVPSEL
jgi:hypothetical protein